MGYNKKREKHITKEEAGSYEESDNYSDNSSHYLMCSIR